MERVEADGIWSLFDPAKTPHFPDLYGAEFEAAYEAAEAAGLYARQVKARDLYGRMMRMLAETGNGWMTFKDSSQCQVQSDWWSWQRRASVESLYGDHRSHLRCRNRCVQSRLDQSCEACDRWRFRFREACEYSQTRRSVPGSRDRYQLLSDRSCGALQTVAGVRWDSVSWAYRTCSFS